MRAGIRDGGRIQGVLVVARTTQPESAFVIYLRVSWTLGYHILRRWRGKGDRILQTADAALQTVWRHGYRGPIQVHRAGDPELARFRGVAPQDKDRQDSEMPAEPIEQPPEC